MDVGDDDVLRALLDRQRQLVQLGLGLLAGADVAEHDAHRLGLVVLGAGRELGPERQTLRPEQPQLPRLRLAALQQLFAKQVIAILVWPVDEARERQPDQRGSGQSEHRRCAEVGLRDQPSPVEAAVAHRRQVIEVEIARPRSLQLGLGLAQFLVLHLKLDLVDLQLVQQSLQGFGRLRQLGGCGPLPEFGLGALAQRRVGLGRGRRAVSAHGRSAWPVAPGDAIKRSVVATA